jgi:hypothetical protein
MGTHGVRNGAFFLDELAVNTLEYTASIEIKVAVPAIKVMSLS